ncbi:MAG TPA: hypothetical protein VGL58_05200 [Caulobacteraceae bacterium]|jgi:hypothetical protein
MVSLTGKAFLEDHTGSEVENQQVARQDLQTFLVGQQVQGLSAVRIRRVSDNWAGWRFTANACPTTVFPLPISGEMNAPARDHAGPNDRVAYLYRGQSSPTAPLAVSSFGAAAYRVVLGRLFRPPPQFYVMVIYPTGCDAVLKLPWAALS